jgi:CheY-like chemotaxis protein
MRLKVLIIDDDPFQIEILEEFIKECGHNVFTSTDPQATIDLVTTHFDNLNPFDVVFIDYMMPEMDGIELCLKLKDIDSALSLIAITSDNSMETRNNLSEFGGFSGAINKAAGFDNIKHHLDIAMSNKKEKLSGRKSLFLERKKKIHKS